MTKKDSPKLCVRLILTLGAIAGLTLLAIDMYLPVMPSIAKDFLVSPRLVQVTLTMYITGFTFGQVIYGPLADSYGRRPILLSGIGLFFIFTVLGALSTNITVLNFTRFLQGFTGAAAAVIVNVLIRDMFEREEFSRAMSFVMLMMTVAPLLAPMIGGYLSVWFGWRAIFWFLAIYTVIVFLSTIFNIKETLPKENRIPFQFISIILNYTKLISNPIVLGLILCGGFSFAGMFTFLTIGSFVYIDIYGVSIENFGFYFGLNIICLIVMTSVNERFVRKKGVHWMLRLGLLIQLFAGTVIVIGQWFDFGLWGVVVPVILYVGIQSIIGSNSMACLLDLYPTMAGTVSSLRGTFRFGIASLVGSLVVLMPDNTALPMAMTMATCALSSAGFYWCLAKHA